MLRKEHAPVNEEGRCRGFATCVLDDRTSNCVVKQMIAFYYETSRWVGDIVFVHRDSLLVR